MSKILDNYQLGFDELNILMSNIVADGVKPSEGVSAIEDFLISTYARGAYATEDDIDEMHELDTAKMFEALNYKVEGKDFRDRASEYLNSGDVLALMKVADTEYHRMFNRGVIDVALSSDQELTKTWVTMGDEKVRDTHFYLEGVTIPVSEKFVTIGGDSAYAPSGFSLPENNINCRCILKIGK